MLQEISELQGEIEIFLDRTMDVKEALLIKNDCAIQQAMRLYRSKADELITLIIKTIYHAKPLQIDKSLAVSVFDMICKTSNVSKDELIKKHKSRKFKYLIPRQIHLSILYTTFNLSLSRAGEFYNKDHATVLSSIRAVNNYLDTDASYREKYKKVFEQCYRINPATLNKLNIHYVIPKI